MDINGSSRRDGDKSRVGHHVVWAADALPQQSSSRSPGMDRSEPLERTSTETTRQLEGDRDMHSSGTIQDFYLSSTRISLTAARIGQFHDEDGARLSEHRLEQPHHLDPTVIFKKVAEDDIQKLAPEQNITLFALRLAIIEKSASGIGTLSFIWASTIILGGFASNINPVDFIVIALILVTEGTRIFSRSRELEWQHLASKSKEMSQARNPAHRELKRSLSFRSRDGTKRRDGASVTPGDEPVPSSSEPTGPITIELGAVNTSRSTIVYSQDDLESGLGSEDKKVHQRTRYLPSISKRVGLTFNKPSSDETTKKQKWTETAEIEDKVKAESGHGKKHQTSRSVEFDQSMNTSGTSPTHQDDSSANITGGSSTEKFPMNVIGTVDVDENNIKRTWSSEVVPILPGSCTFSMLSTRGVSAILYWIQITSAVICLVLSCWRLSQQEFNPPAVTREDTPVNLYTSVNIFYALALTEALLYLLERVYWVYKIDYEQLVEHVSNKADLGKEHQETIKQFFYEVYKKCIDGSVFDGLDMDIVEYSLTLLQSDNSFELLSGLRVLRKTVDRHDGFSLDALRRIGAAPGVIERLVEMLTWRGSSHQAEEIRLEVAALICRMVRYSKNCFRVAAVPGAMEGIVSLLSHKPTDPLMTSERATALRLDGLRILVAQARDPVSLRKIGETRGLVPILVSFIAVTDVDAFMKMEGSELKTFKKVLRLLKMLAGARNATGLMLRPVIVRVVFGIASMRDILEFGDCHPHLQWMAIEILNNLTLDDDIRRAIGSTGGVIRNLVTLYSRPLDWSSKGLFELLLEKDKKAERAVSKRAGDALNLLATMSKKNCLRMMDLQDGNGKKTFIPTLISLLNEYREQTICAAKILRSLLEYGSHSQKREIAVCIERVMTLVMGSSSQRMHEAIVGLAPRALAVLNEATYNQVFEYADRTELAQKLLKNLEYNAQASSKFPRIRRHSIEFILALLNRDPNFFREFMRDGLLEKMLMLTLDSICEAEDFVIFSGAEGLIRHSITMEDLVLQSLREVRNLEQERHKTPLEILELAAVKFT